MTTNHIEIQWDNVFNGQRQCQQSRQGDWICIQCNNLNFSFRKRCNRCKNQSRQDNEQQIRQAYQYYSEYYRQIDANAIHEPQTLTLNNHSHMSPYDNPSFAFQHPQPSQFDDQCYETSLPSVSPYIRRYKSPNNKMIKTQISQGWSSDEQSNQSKQEYLSQYCWQNIMVQDYYEQQSIENPNNQQDYSQMQRLVQNIVL